MIKNLTDYNADNVNACLRAIDDALLNGQSYYARLLRAGFDGADRTTLKRTARRHVAFMRRLTFRALDLQSNAIRASLIASIQSSRAMVTTDIQALLKAAEFCERGADSLEAEASA
jgi:hypothetical protein